MTTKLDEVADLFARAKSPTDVFGDDVEGAYRKLAGMCHPDQHPTELDRAKELFQQLQEWKELADRPAVIVEGSKAQYQLHSIIATGDLCDLYYASTPEPRFFVAKVPRIPNAQQLMAKEREVIEQLREASKNTHYHLYFPPLVESFTSDVKGFPTRINIFEWREWLYSAEQIQQKHEKLNGRHLGWMFNRMLVAIGFAHRQKWVHGAVLPPHLMFIPPPHGMILVDWINAVQIGKPLQFLPQRFRSWYPAEVLAKKPVGPTADIYMAAKCLIWLGGNDITMLPIPMQHFLKACLLDSPGMREPDAWVLQDDWSKLLESLYGRPKFIALNM